MPLRLVLPPQAPETRPVLCVAVPPRMVGALIDTLRFVPECALPPLCGRVYKTSEKILVCLCIGEHVTRISQELEKLEPTGVAAAISTLFRTNDLVFEPERRNLGADWPIARPIREPTLSDFVFEGEHKSVATNLARVVGLALHALAAGKEFTASLIARGSTVLTTVGGKVCPTKLCVDACKRAKDLVAEWPEMKIRNTSEPSGTILDSLDHSVKACIAEGVSLASETQYLLTGLDVYTLWEPCIFCAMCLLHARVKRVFYLIQRPANGGLNETLMVPRIEGLNHRYSVMQGFPDEFAEPWSRVMELVTPSDDKKG
ncbi:Adenoside deaminase/Cytosine deaminase [Giardia muris]|uniref:Adenoside deaminase/Cytosine deaminase n=1 Tax=Giardia muris TaxID=5742 RepID=A0A4Z1TB07_GIAMU|nr:Adenoside deaminase/Cytosine deaminase [Giardia muris]|eukprot:TNJ30427.1 Adenoside deaminase/Cytosine deaminase [Giardia muris]